MLFFQIEFLLYFLAPLILIILLARLFRAGMVLPWIGSAFSFVFLYAYNELSVWIAALSIGINFLAARLLLRKRTLLIFGVTVAANLLVLAYFKYSIFLTHDIIGRGGSLAWSYALPLGVSFYTFQQIAFIADVYRGKVTDFSFKTYILFKLYFPQFIAGPIVHFERVRASYERWPTFNARSIRFALIIFAIGMVKKLIGDHFGAIANIYFPRQSSLNGYEAWLAMLAFTFQIYFDFSGYSDMAVGLGRLFGVSLPFNFNSPYKSRSITDFWRRWHMTLSNWLRDYLYIPLGGNRRGVAIMYASLMTTMLLGGLWHGAGWNFIWWGAAHGLALIWCRLFPYRLPHMIGMACTFLFVALTWILFRSPTFAGAVEHFARLFDVTPGMLGIEIRRLVYVFVPIERLVDSAVQHPQQLNEVGALLGAFAWCFLLPNSQAIALRASARDIMRFKLTEIPLLVLLILVLSLAFISPDTTNAFIYFQF